MPAWVWIVAAAAVAFVLLVTFSRTGRVWWGGAVLWRIRWVLDWAWCLSAPRWWYSWRRARHVLAAECDWCGPGKRCTCRREADPDFYGSMTLAGEREAYPLPWPRLEGDWLPAPPGHQFTWRGGPVGELDWREQTAADLAPEALDEACVLCAGCAGFSHCDGLEGACDCTCCFASDWAEDDPGPGDLPSLDPGPDQGPFCSLCPDAPLSWRDGGACWERCAQLGRCALSVPSRLADTADVMDAHLLADVEAYMRAQDDDARAYGSARALGWAGFMRDLEAALT